MKREVPEPHGGLGLDQFSPDRLPGGAEIRLTEHVRLVSWARWSFRWERRDAGIGAARKQVPTRLGQPARLSARP